MWTRLRQDLSAANQRRVTSHFQVCRHFDASLMAANRPPPSLLSLLFCVFARSGHSWSMEGASLYLLPVLGLCLPSPCSLVVPACQVVSLAVRLVAPSSPPSSVLLCAASCSACSAPWGPLACKPLPPPPLPPSRTRRLHRFALCVCKCTVSANATGTGYIYCCCVCPTNSLCGNTFRAFGPINSRF